MPLDRLAKRAKEGVRAAGGFPIEFMHDRRERRHLDGPRGHAGSLVSREVIADSVETVMHAERFDALVTFAGCDKSPARDADGRGPAQPAVGVPLRRVDPARRSTTARRSTSSACSRRSAPTRRARITDERAGRHRAQRVPDRGQLRRHVHRQHDGVGRRGARHVAARQRRRAPAVDRRRDDFAYESGEAVMRAARAGHPPPPDPHQGGVRERHRRRDGARRLDQRGAAPAGHRQRGRASSSSSTTSTASARAVPHIADTKPHGKLPHDRSRPRRRRARRACSTCSTPGCSTATASPSPARRWPRTSADLDPPAPDGDGRPPADRADPRRRRHRRCSAARSRRRARS